MDNAYALLTQEDKDFIETLGTPFPPRSDLTLVSSDGSVTFTIKGAQFYKLALEQHGLDWPLSSLKTLKDLYRVGDKLLMMKRSDSLVDLRTALHTNRLPKADREWVSARLYGTLESWWSAVTRRAACAVHGDNVVPFPEKK